jgi:hypothetical protein
MLLAKMGDQWVEIVRFADQVQFSPDTGWFMIGLDWNRPSRSQARFRWVPADTRFEKLQELID